MDRLRNPNVETTSTSPVRHARTSPGALLAVLAVLVSAVLGACTAAPTAPAPSPRRAADGDGYRLLGYAAPTAFTLRIHSSAAAATADVLDASSEVTAASGITFTVGTPAGSDHPDPGTPIPELVVSVGSYCGAGAVGCARVWSSTAHGLPTITGVHVSVVAGILNQPDLLRAVVLHELGHAVGLDHQVEPFLGRAQVMNPHVDESMDSYREGDLAGLSALGAARHTSVVSAGARHTRDDDHTHDGADGPLLIA